MGSSRALLLFAAVVLLSVSTMAENTPPDVVLENSSKFKAVLTPIGASIRKLLVPLCKDKSETVDVALGYDDISAYARDPHPSFGATVGRVANRISGAQFTIDGKTYKLTANEGSASIHGGSVRWSKQQWEAEKSSDGLSVVFKYISKDGESGFPGTVTTKVTYSIPESGSRLNIDISASTNKPTPLNIINHNYFNLKGAGNGDILDHIVEIPSQYYTPSPPGDLIPTGQILGVSGTVYDFTKATPIRKRYLQANGGKFKGYDLNYVMPGPDDKFEPVWWQPGQNPQVSSSSSSRNADDLKLAATVTEPTTGLKLKVFTTAPGIHFYSGNFMAAKESEYAAAGKGGALYPQYGGFCFEAQAFPNAINTATFPSSVVRPGETFSNKVSYDFSCS